MFMRAWGARDAADALAESDESGRAELLAPERQREHSVMPYSVGVHRRAGRLEDRARIIAWLRRQAFLQPARAGFDLLTEVADEIEGWYGH